MSRDRKERRHRRTAAHPAAVEIMGNADFAAVPSLSEAMGLDRAAGIGAEVRGVVIHRLMRELVSNGDIDQVANSIEAFARQEIEALLDASALLRSLSTAPLVK